MARLSRAVMVLGVCCIVLGAITGGVGFYFASQSDCESGSQLSVAQISEDQTAGSNTELREYGDLSDPEQRIFRDLLGSTRQNFDTYDNSSAANELVNTVVIYRGERYVTRAVIVDCYNRGEDIQGLGELIAIVGLILFVPAYRYR
ncbi:hypothetical protein Hbl1158_11105 [Halobaculum sp. CBA1158]|uniref:hypothetical protein n=1 Tax=Halobaculum sp. CBA1158 TaxID=2904243 RepID=UPI001F196E41|nr:hypothetical protein [Halobaculum sp. CBA1158]UIO99078.1 hypothetical protein Hbl1158_11105 [Halobaculum sp. CBA1158]